MLIEVLLLHRHMDDADVIAGITAALSVGAHAADVVAVEARKAAEARGRAGSGPAAAAMSTEAALGRAGQVTSLTLRRLADLPPDTRPLPTVAAYDQLLRHPRPSKEGRP